MFRFLLSTLFINSIWCSNYILMRKPNTGELFTYQSDYDSFYNALVKKYDLELFATINNVLFYTTTDKNVFLNKKVLSDFYDIEEDRKITLDTTDFVLVDKEHMFNIGGEVQEDLAWHLRRIVKKKLPLQTNYPYSQKGSCHRNNLTVINSYVVDTGIDVSHPEFEGRAVWGSNFADEMNTDCNSHGTHVAGLIGSKTYGVCVDAKLFAVKVLDCDGSGTLSGVIKGIEWVYNKHNEQKESFKKKGDTRVLKSIINMSLGGGYSAAINRAVEACVSDESNFYVVVAAGNENADACKTSPASVKNIITVMASDVSDSRAWFSNWGSCANIYAPGVDIVSTVPDNKFAKYSGTSMASPVMAGVLNHYLDMHYKQNMTEIAKTVYLSATKDMIEGDKKKTPNLLVYLQR
jgi:cerevisin